MISPWWWRGMRALSRCELAVFSSSHVSGRKKTGGREERSRSLKRKLSVSAERQDWNCAVSPTERSVSMGFPQAWHTLSVSVILVQGRPAHLTMTVRHLQQRCENSSFSEALWIDAGWLQGMTDSASWSLQELLIQLLEAFQGLIPASAKKGVRRWREEIWDAVAGQLII